MLYEIIKVNNRIFINYFRFKSDQVYKALPQTNTYKENLLRSKIRKNIIRHKCKITSFTKRTDSEIKVSTKISSPNKISQIKTSISQTSHHGVPSKSGKE